MQKTNFRKKCLIGKTFLRESWQYFDCMSKFSCVVCHVGSMLGSLPNTSVGLADI